MGKNNINKFVDIVLPTEAADSYYMNKNKHYIDDFIFIEQEWYDKLFCKFAHEKLLTCA